MLNKTRYKSDHSIVLLDISCNTPTKGPGYSKFNNSLLLDETFIQKIKDCINETVQNNNCNPNTLWEVMKGNIRNESIKYSTQRKKHTTDREIFLLKEIEKVENIINTTSDDLDVKIDNLDLLKQELECIIDSKIKGHIIRAKATQIEYSEKNPNILPI